MIRDPDSLDSVIDLVRQMEITLHGLKELRRYVKGGVGQYMLELLIEEAERRLAEVKGKLAQ